MHAQLNDDDRDRAALYALHALPADEARAFEAHLASGCPSCRAEVDALARVTDELAFAAPAVTPPAALRARLMRCTTTDFDARLFFLRASEGGWIELGPGLHRKDLTPTPNGDVFLIRLDPGARAVTHGHPRVEHCYVLEGDLLVAGVELGPGDHHVAAAGTTHDGLTSRGGCLLLIAELPG